MKLVNMTCPHCGGILKINTSEKLYVCEYCESKLVLDNDTLHIQINNADESDFNIEKGHKHTKSETYIRQTSTATQSVLVQKVKKRTWIWVIGWIFIFPIPLTVIMLKNNALDKKIKHGIIAAAWIVYLLIIGVIGVNATTESESNITASSSINEDILSEGKNNETTGDIEEDVVLENADIETNSLNDFLLVINADIAKNEIVELSEKYNLFSDGKKSGTGHYTYRFSETKEVANAIKAEKGSVITVTYNLLDNNEMEEITYFDESRMVAGFWTPSCGYTMTDYNNPQIISESATSQIPISSFTEIIDYVPQISESDNLLEELFLTVSNNTTKADILNFAETHSLIYDSRGKGNEQMIAYTADVINKYGNSGSYISFDCDNNDIITQISYCEYPYYYRTGYNAVYYSDSYPYSDLTGYYLYQYKEEPLKYNDARSLIDEINSNRK